MSSKHELGRASVFHLQNHAHITTGMIFQLYKWHFDINSKKRWANVFQFYPNATVTHFNPHKFCPSMSLLGFPVFCLSFSKVFSRYLDVLVNYMTIWSVLKSPKIAWPSPFNMESSVSLVGTWIYYTYCRMIIYIHKLNCLPPCKGKTIFWQFTRGGLI